MGGLNMSKDIILTETSPVPSLVLEQDIPKGEMSRCQQCNDDENCESLEGCSYCSCKEKCDAICFNGWVAKENKCRCQENAKCFEHGSMDKGCTRRGACCFEGVCLDNLNSNDCRDSGGEFIGEWTSCKAHGCGGGRCCMFNHSLGLWECSEVSSEPICYLMGGNWTAGADCDSGDCGDETPLRGTTESELVWQGACDAENNKQDCCSLESCCGVCCNNGCMGTVYNEQDEIDECITYTHDACKEINEDAIYGPCFEYGDTLGGQYNDCYCDCSCFDEDNSEGWEYCQDDPNYVNCDDLQPGVCCIDGSCTAGIGSGQCEELAGIGNWYFDTSTEYCDSDICKLGPCCFQGTSGEGSPCVPSQTANQCILLEMDGYGFGTPDIGDDWTIGNCVEGVTCQFGACCFSTPEWQEGTSDWAEGTYEQCANMSESMCDEMASGDGYSDFHPLSCDSWNEPCCGGCPCEPSCHMDPNPCDEPVGACCIDFLSTAGAGCGGCEQHFGYCWNTTRTTCEFWCDNHGCHKWDDDEGCNQNTCCYCKTWWRGEGEGGILCHNVHPGQSNACGFGSNACSDPAHGEDLLCKWNQSTGAATGQNLHQNPGCYTEWWTGDYPSGPYTGGKWPVGISRNYNDWGDACGIQCLSRAENIELGYIFDCNEVTGCCIWCDEDSCDNGGELGCDGVDCSQDNLTFAQCLQRFSQFDPDWMPVQTCCA